MTVKTTLNYNSFTLIFLLLVFCIGCRQVEKEHRKNTIIKGKISDLPLSKIYFCSYPDSVNQLLGKKIALDSCTTDKEGNYFFSPAWNKPALFDLSGGTKLFVSNLFLSPGDHITVDLLNQAGSLQVSITGNGSKYNDYLTKFVNIFFWDPPVKKYYYNESNRLTFQQYIAYIDARQRQQLAFFGLYFQNERPSKMFSDFALSEINYQSAADKLLFLWKKKMKGELVKPDSSYYVFLKQVKIENRDALISPTYQRFLELYIDELYQQAVEKIDYVSSESKTFSSLAEKRKIAEVHLHGIFRDLIYARLILDEWKSSSVTSQSTKDTTVNSIISEMGEPFKSFFLRNDPTVQSEPPNDRR